MMAEADVPPPIVGRSLAEPTASAAATDRLSFR